MCRHGTTNSQTVGLLLFDINILINLSLRMATVSETGVSDVAYFKNFTHWTAMLELLMSKHF